MSDRRSFCSPPRCPALGARWAYRTHTWVREHIHVEKPYKKPGSCVIHRNQKSKTQFSFKTVKAMAGEARRSASPKVEAPWRRTRASLTATRKTCECGIRPAGAEISKCTFYVVGVVEGPVCRHGIIINVVFIIIS